MFWQAVLGGLKVLLHWETGVAGLIYIALLMIPMTAVGLLLQMRPGIGCVTHLLVLPLAQVLATVIVTIILSPIILGFSDDAAWLASWMLISTQPGWVIRIVLWATIATVLAAFVPVLGQIPTFPSFASACCAIASVADLLRRNRPELRNTPLAVAPDFWTIVGFLFIGSLTFMLGTGLMAILVSLRQGKSSTRPQGSLPEPDVWSLAAASMLGLVPGFMYGAWLGIQLQ